MIIIYVGRKGRGKTLTLVKDAYKYHLEGWKILSNMQELRFGENFNPKDLFDNNFLKSLKNTVLVIDEIQHFFDSRRSMNKKNVDFTHFLQQIRKNNIRLLGSIQRLGNVDLRVREQLDISVFPNHNKIFGVCEVRYVDETSIEDDELGSTLKSEIKIVFDARPVYQLYNTREQIILNHE